MKKKILPVLITGLTLMIGFSGCSDKEAVSQSIIDELFAQEMTLKEFAKTQTSRRQVINRAYPGRGSSISTPTTKASLWGGGHEITMSLLKTDIIDRRYIDREHFTMDDLIKGAFSDANRSLNDMPMAGMTRPKFFVLDERGGRYNYAV